MRPDLLRFVTIGSVDDGKSTLIGRLLADTKSLYRDHAAAVRADSRRLNRDGVDLALLLDGLRTEREQGITIDVAYRHFSTPMRRFIIADCPGHVQYTRNMATGASTAEAAVILIDARRGIVRQSKLHGFIASLLGIRHLIVAVNKMDLVGYSRKVFEHICDEYGEFSSRLDQPDLIYIPISALKGDNVVRKSRRMPWYQGVPLLHQLQNIQTAASRNLVDFRFPVQYVNRPNSDFRGYCGTVASGVVRVGDEITALPSGQRSRVKRIVSFDGDMKYAFPPLSVTLCLEDELDISRGEMLARPANLPNTARHCEAMLIWMDEAPLQTNRVYGVKIGTRFIRASCPRLHFRINPDGLHRENAPTLKLNEIGRADVEFFEPAVFDYYQRNRATGGFIMVDLESNATAGAGVIIERVGTARAERKRRMDQEREIHPVRSIVQPSERRRLLGHKPMVIWLTGLSGSGKSTLARNLEKQLIDMGHAAFVLDGDNIRSGLNRDLGFSAADRTENIRRVAEVASLMADAGLIVITAFISPYRDDRRMAREIIGNDRFFEVHVSTPLAVCERRDTKALYENARSGKLADFTGINAPYEEPEAPDLSVSAEESAPNEMASKVLENIAPSL